MSDTKKEKPKAAKQRLTRQDGIILIIIGIIFFILYYTFILPYIQSLLPEEPYLVAFDFIENEWFEGDVRIVDNFQRADVVVVNDELFYSIAYNNKKDHEITIEPQLEVMYGGQVVQTIEDIPAVTIAPKESGSHKVRFFSDKVGMNQIIYKVNVVNSSDSTSYGSVQETFNIPVYSQEAAEQRYQNESTVLGIAISIPVGFATIVGLIVSLSLSRRQAEEARKENELTVQQMRETERRHNIEKRDKRQTLIGEHTSKILEEVKNAFAGVDAQEVVGLDWIDRIEHSKHSKRLIQHLFTDRTDLFNLLNEAIDYKEKAQTTKMELWESIQDLIASEITQIGSHKNNETETKRFIAEAAQYMMDNIGTKDFRNFDAQYKESMGKMYYVTQPGFQYSLVYLQKDPAEAIASKLNEIAMQSATIEKCSSYQELTRKAVALRQSCENKFEDLLSAVRTHGTKVQGACEDCIKEYDEEASRFQSSFNELEKMSLYLHLVGKQD